MSWPEPVCSSKSAMSGSLLGPQPIGKSRLHCNIKGHLMDSMEEYWPHRFVTGKNKMREFSFHVAYAI